MVSHSEQSSLPAHLLVYSPSCLGQFLDVRSGCSKVAIKQVVTTMKLAPCVPWAAGSPRVAFSGLLFPVLTCFWPRWLTRRISPRDLSLRQVRRQRRTREGLAQVIVTAHKGTERLQAVPMSLTALSARIWTSQAFSTSRTSARGAGLSVVSLGPGATGSSARPLLQWRRCHRRALHRRQPISSPTLNLDNDVMDPSLFGLDRVEVLRGPQERCTARARSEAP